ncbi:MAG: virulence factor, partial [Pseudomonadota bacterium]
GGDMASLIVVYWRDIPAQVIAKKSRREQVKIVLDERFEKAIDRAAMRGKARDTDSYLAEWRKSEPEECGDDIQQQAQAKAQELEAAFDTQRLNAFVANAGRTPA